ncbi:MAG TPA: hypothetical protein PK735_11235, partial [Flavobacteriales bacterium]|nr:hypothetical protein [Flavobacteriales bacterium]
MLKSLLLFLAVSAFSFTSLAQVSDQAPSKELLQSCLLGTTDDVWNELKLTYDQQKRMKFVQEACAEECSVAAAKKEPNSISNADGSTILSEVEHILTPEQFKKW